MVPNYADKLLLFVDVMRFSLLLGKLIFRYVVVTRETFLLHSDKVGRVSRDHFDQVIKKVKLTGRRKEKGFALVGWHET